MYLLLGTLGLLALATTLVLGMRTAERLVARWLGLPGFRWFEVEGVAPGNATAGCWKRFLVRLASGSVPFALAAAMFFVVNLVGGASEMTTVVTVLPEGAALEAGMRDGDKVLAVGGVPVPTWEELRAQVQAHSGPVQVTIERSGQRQNLSVNPRSGRIGVAPAVLRREAGLAEAASLALQQPFRIVSQAAQAFVAVHESSELKGPVGIVREGGSATRAGWLAVLQFLGLLVSYFWPFVVGVHLFDVITGWTFRMTAGDADSPRPATRIARLRFSMYCALGCWLAVGLAELAAAAGLPGAVLLVGLLVPGVWALWPLLWISAQELWAPRWPLGVVLPVTLVPCAALIMGVWVAFRLRAEERRLRTH